uniref:Uncharacterized protein n=1 Tax=Candidozyma auris TaxID=498019 RepID=A0A0L0P1E1_CANAR
MLQHAATLETLQEPGQNTLFAQLRHYADSFEAMTQIYLNYLHRRLFSAQPMCFSKSFTSVFSPEHMGANKNKRSRHTKPTFQINTRGLLIFQTSTTT